MGEFSSKEKRESLESLFNMSFYTLGNTDPVRGGNKDGCMAFPINDNYFLVILCDAPMDRKDTDGHWWREVAPEFIQRFGPPLFAQTAQTIRSGAELLKQGIKNLNDFMWEQKNLWIRKRELLGCAAAFALIEKDPQDRDPRVHLAKASDCRYLMRTGGGSRAISTPIGATGLGYIESQSLLGQLELRSQHLRPGRTVVLWTDGVTKDTPDFERSLSYMEYKGNTDFYKRMVENHFSNRRNQPRPDDESLVLITRKT